MRYGRLFPALTPDQVETPEYGINAFVNIDDSNQIWGKFEDGLSQRLFATGAGDGNIYDNNGILNGARTVNMDGNQLTFNNGDFLIETDSADAYIAVIGDQVVLGGSDHVWVDTGRLQLGGPFTGGTPEIYFNDGVTTGQLVSNQTANRTWTLPDQTGMIGVNAGGTGFTPSNVTPDFSYDADATTLDEVADVLGTLIGELQSAQVIN